MVHLPPAGLWEVGPAYLATLVPTYVADKLAQHGDALLYFGYETGRIHLRRLLVYIGSPLVGATEGEKILGGKRPGGW